MSLGTHTHRAVILRCAVLLLAATAVLIACRPRTWLILGDSMAPALLGPHLSVDCPDCGFPFAVSAAAAADTAVCPNCGLREIPLANSDLREGRRVSLKQAELDRFDLAAYQTQGGKRMVKRVVGLPGELLEVRQGELWIDGRRLVKSLAQLRQMAVLVHDSRYVSRQLGPRWRGELGQWTRNTGGSWQLRSGGDAKLAYHHRVSYEGRRPRSDADVVRDHYSLNASLSRSLNVVNDQLLEVQLRARGGTLRIVFDDGIAETGARWDLDRRTLQLLGESRTAPVAPPASWTTLHVGCFDGQLLAAVDGRVLLRGPGSARGPGSQQPWRVESHGAGVEIRRLRIWRDVHYEIPYGGRRSWQLNERQWLLLGDNVPASWDSRQTGPVGHKWLMGRVLP